jgi:hypothetical protein
MKKSMLQPLTVILLALITTPLFSFAPLHQSLNPPRWEKLGDRKINYALQIKVRFGAINMSKMVVHFGNGETKEIELRDNFSAGSSSRVIDLPGNNRIITKVVFWYDTKNRSRLRARIELWGRH